MSVTCQPGDSFDAAGESNPFGKGKLARDVGPAQYPHQPVDLSSSRCAAATPIIRIQQAQRVRVQLQPLDRNGALIQHPSFVEWSSTGGGSSGTGPFDQFTFRLVCDHYTGARQHVFDILGEVVDPENSVIEFLLTEEETKRAGAFVCHLMIHMAGEYDYLLHATPYWLEIQANPMMESSGPPTIAEIRMMLRDACADPEGLLGDFEYPDQEIFMYIRQPVDQFNATRPPFTNYTVSNFPRQFRYYWMRATLGLLLRARGTEKMRNALSYQAGGVSVNDNDKYADYLKLADTYLKEWEAWMIERKAQMNISKALGVVPSDYGRGAVNP